MAPFFKTLQLQLHALYNRLRGVQDIILTPENSGLKSRQIGASRVGRPIDVNSSTRTPLNPPLVRARRNWSQGPQDFGH